MKTITRIFVMLAVMSAVIFMDACKAEIGPAGPTGSPGATGITGAIGATGANGTANVSYSDWLNITFVGSSNNYIVNVAAPKSIS